MPRKKTTAAIISTLCTVCLIMGFTAANACADDVASPRFQVDGEGDTVKIVASQAVRDANSQNLPSDSRPADDRSRLTADSVASSEAGAYFDWAHCAVEQLPHGTILSRRAAGYAPTRPQHRAQTPPQHASPPLVRFCWRLRP